MKKWKISAELFLYFFRIGFFTFGGGMSIVAQLQKDFVDKKHWVSSEELLDIVSIGRSIPGTMITNVAYLFGHQMGGIFCGLLCLLGMTLPSVIVLAFVTWFYGYFQNAAWFSRIMTGVRAAVVPIVGSAALRMKKGISWNGISRLIFVLAFALSVWGLQPPLIILLSAAIGFFYYRGKRGDTP